MTPFEPVRYHYSFPGRRMGQPLASLVGNTPLLPLDRFAAAAAPARIFAKAEWYNPGGSVKDRAAREILREAVDDGRLAPGRVILDATSGNTGIAYAMLGAASGYAVKIVLPANASAERKRILRALGADLVFTPAGDGTDGAILKAREIHAADPGRYFYADQYANDANWRAHYRTTAEEIWRQTEGRITHFVAVLGTSGTFMGTTRRLRELNPAVRCVSVQPDVPFHGLEGMKHMESAMVPPIYDPRLADETLGVSTETAYRAVRTLARREGLLAGVSSGAALAASLEVALREPREPGSLIVTILPDSADKYLGERFWEEEPAG